MLMEHRNTVEAVNLLVKSSFSSVSWYSFDGQSHSCFPITGRKCVVLGLLLNASGLVLQNLEMNYVKRDGLLVHISFLTGQIGVFG